MPLSEPLPLLIDTDCGIDDAQAIVAALSDRLRSNVIAITSVSGNTCLENATLNVCACLEATDRNDVPVYRGCEHPIVEPVRSASAWHGEDGLGLTCLGSKANTSCVQSEHAVCAIIRISKEWADKNQRITLVTLGPLTNIAIALRLDPKLSMYIDKIVIMSGAYKAAGNASLCAEYNAHSDPEAFSIVIGGFPNIQLVTWELTLTNGLSCLMCQKWWNNETKEGRFLKKISQHLQDVSQEHSELSPEEFNQKGFYIPDPLCMAVACRPESILLSRKRRVVVELNTGHTRGMTIVDHSTKGVDQSLLNVEIIESVDLLTVETFLLSSTTTRT
jgi:purine nucleosidase